MDFPILGIQNQWCIASHEAATQRPPSRIPFTSLQPNCTQTLRSKLWAHHIDPCSGIEFCPSYTISKKVPILQNPCQTSEKSVRAHSKHPYFESTTKSSVGGEVGQKIFLGRGWTHFSGAPACIDGPAKVATSVHGRGLDA